MQLHPGPPPQRRAWTPTWQPLAKPPTRMSWPVALSVGSGAGGRRCSGPPWMRRRRYWTKYDAPQPRAAPLLGACPRTTGQVPHADASAVKASRASSVIQPAGRGGKGDTGAMTDEAPADQRPDAVATKAAKKTQALLREARSSWVASRRSQPRPERSTIRHRINLLPRRARPSSGSPITLPGWSGSTIAGLIRLRLPGSIDNADPASPSNHRRNGKSRASPDGHASAHVVSGAGARRGRCHWSARTSSAAASTFPGAHT